MERLRQIATEMKTQAAATGQSQRTLPHGLTLTLRKVGPQYTLSLTRKVGIASETERSICRGAFNCPDIPKTDLENYMNTSNPNAKQRPTLAMMARKKLWPTPTASEKSNRETTIKPSCLKGTHGWSLAGAVQDNSRESPAVRWPTPTVNNSKNNGSPSQAKRHTSLDTMAGGKLNPTWVEWLMGWPIGWTDLEPLETAKFRQWLEKFGGC